MSIPSLAAHSLHERASAPALDADYRGTAHQFAFGDLDARSDRLAFVLAARGLAAGDRLAFYLANRVEIIDLWLACAKLGVIVVPVNVLYRDREIRHILADAAPTAVVSAPQHAADLPAGATCWMIDELDALAESAPQTAVAHAAGDDTPAALVYTSGTTGPAKGAILTHGNFTANARALVSAWRITAGDRYLAVLPLFHVHGLGNGVHAWLASGCHMRLCERFHLSPPELDEIDQQTVRDWITIGNYEAEIQKAQEKLGRN